MGFPKLVECVDDENTQYSNDELVKGNRYVATGCVHDFDYSLEGKTCSWRIDRFVVLKEDYNCREGDVVVAEQPSQKAIDSHYSKFLYTHLITAEEASGGVVTLKIDPYFVSKQWGLGKKDDTGVLFHCLKNISRYSDKNTKEREIKALYLQVKRLAELENVNLE